MLAFFFSWFACLDYGVQRLAPEYRAHTNYGQEVWTLAEEEQLPYSYLMALIVLECGGKSPCGKRYEAHVFRRLQQVREGRRAAYGPLVRRDLQGVSDAALRNLATSWGPFQLMGYQSIGLNTTVLELRSSETALNHGLRWIAETYGDDLRAGRYKDAFHRHNTGRPFPVDGQVLTHDPLYVEKGLRYMTFFQQPTFSF